MILGKARTERNGVFLFLLLGLEDVRKSRKRSSRAFVPANVDRLEVIALISIIN